MEKKSAISELQEYCHRVKTGHPLYEYTDGEKGGFICKVVLLDNEAFGKGRSKQDAKRLAASNMMRSLRKVPGFGSVLAATETKDASDDVKNTTVDEPTKMDMLKELRDYCVRHDMPLPVMEIVSKSRTPDASQFDALCSVASIKTYGRADKKKDARQRAATEMMGIISLESEKKLPEEKPKNVSGLGTNTADTEDERRRKFKTYRELTDSGERNDTSVKLCDRHNYFKNYYPHLKTAAFQVLNSNEYTSSKSKLMAVLSALKLTARTTQLKAFCEEPILQIELDCEYDCVFLGFESKVYDEMIQYFQDMLV